MKRPDRSPSNALVWLSAAVVGAALLFASDLLVPPAEQPYGLGNRGHGALFAGMVADPFALVGDFPQRKLWPVLAWLFSHAGVSPVGFTRICNGALLAVVFWFAHRRLGSFVGAGLAAAAIATSGAVLVYKPMACYSDTLNLILLILLVEFAARPRVFWSLVLVSALSHELVFFFAPWLVYLRCRNGGVWWREGLLLALVLGLYLLFRAPMQSSYGIAYYLEKNFWVPWLLPALWSLWLLVVVVEFGPLLLLIGWSGRRDGELAARDGLGGRFGLALYLVSLLPLMALAYDVMRFATFVFLPVLLGAVAMARTSGGRLLLAALVAVAVPCYGWLHPVAAHQGGRHFTEISGPVFARIRPHVPELGPAPAGPSFDATAWMFGQYPVTFVCVVLAAVGSFLAGRRLRGRWSLSSG